MASRQSIDRAAAVDRGMDNAVTMGALSSWQRRESLGAPLWAVSPVDTIVRVPSTMTTHEAELFLAGVAAGLTAGGR